MWSRSMVRVSTDTREFMIRRQQLVLYLTLLMVVVYSNPTRKDGTTGNRMVQRDNTPLCKSQRMLSR